MARQKHHERVAFETSQKKARSLTIQEAVTAREILLVVVNSAIHSDLVVLWFVSKKWLPGFHLIYGQWQHHCLVGYQYEVATNPLFLGPCLDISNKKIVEDDHARQQFLQAADLELLSQQEEQGKPGEKIRRCAFV